MLAGAALMPPAVTLGVLAGRQARRDAAVRDFNVRTGRPRPALGLAPRVLLGGGGIALTLSYQD